MKRLYTLALVAFCSFFTLGQTVSHLNGTVNINGTDVTVTKSGCADAWYQYCPTETSPYMAGFTLSPTNNCDGYYNFEFSPPIESLTLNFSGVTNVASHQELVTLSVNGAHYPITSQGMINTCDDYAVVTPEGHIAGCHDCIESGWNGTTISGPISQLRVKDSVLIGSPGGTIFSLSITTSVSVEENTSFDLEAYPNPFADQIVVSAPEPGSILLYDTQGIEQLTVKVLSGKNSIDTENLAAGVYILAFTSASGEQSFSKLIKP